MAQICELNGIKPLTGHKVSNSNIKTKRRQNPNLHKRSVFIPELKKSVSMTLSSRAIRTMDRLGAAAAILKQKEDLLSTKLRRIQRDLRR
jgi:large subunit ribosomal protein L28